MKINRWILLIIIVSLTGCKSMERITNGNNQEPKKDQIVFHHFLAKKQSDTIVIKELASSFRDGRIKDINNHPDDLYNPLEAAFLDKSGNRIHTAFIEHPLIKEFEYSSEADLLNRITTYEDSAIFMIRYNSIEKLQSILFSSINQDTLAVHTKIELQK